jgi:hypothetical protein
MTVLLKNHKVQLLLVQERVRRRLCNVTQESTNFKANHNLYSKSQDPAYKIQLLLVQELVGRRLCMVGVVNIVHCALRPVARSDQGPT